MNLIVGPLSIVAASVIVILFALTVFLSVIKCTVKRFITIVLFNETYTMILVVFKVALISRFFINHVTVTLFSTI